MIVIKAEVTSNFGVNFYDMYHDILINENFDHKKTLIFTIFIIAPNSTSLINDKYCN